MADQAGEIDIITKDGFQGSLPFKDFKKWLLNNCLTEQQLQLHHFPRAHPSVPGKAKVFNLPHKFVRTIPREGERKCRFCFINYKIDDDGNEIGVNTCNYHPFSRPPPKQMYRCCGRKRMGSPCVTRHFHVTSDVDINNLNNFIHTKQLPGHDTAAVYALDCEFVHTKRGQELAAITIIDHNEDIVMDTFVKPDNPIIDYLPQFSNLSESNFQSNCISNAEFREKISKILGPDVIIIGHSLYGDLLRMNVIHDKVVDTAVIYPHPHGDAYLMSLRNLVDEYLGDVTFPKQTSKAYQDSVLTLRLVKWAAWNGR